MRTHSFLSKIAICLIVAGFSVAAVAGERQDARLTTATRVLTELMQMPEQNIPTWLLERAHAVAVKACWSCARTTAAGAIRSSST